MLDRAGEYSSSVYSNELFRFSTTTMQWEQLDAPQVSGSPPSARAGHGMVAVGSNLYVFGGTLGGGDTRRCAACIRLAACQIERLGVALRMAAVLVATWCARAGCHAVPLLSLETRDPSHGTVSHRGGADEHKHIEWQMVHRGPCRG